MERRELLKAAIAAATATTVVSVASAQTVPSRPQLVWTLFARHLQWLSTAAAANANPYATGVLLGEAVQRVGLKAIDLPVRRDGCVDPERDSLEVNLPAMLRGLRSTGATCEQITTAIETLDTPLGRRDGRAVLPEQLLRIASDQGVRLYRWGGFNYEANAFGDGLLAQLDGFARRVETLAALNQRLGMTALYHTFSGGRGARSIWDLMYLLRRFPAEQLAINFDIGHVTREGALSAWRSNLAYAMPRIRGVVLKDGAVARNADGTVQGSFPAAGSGLVQWQEFFALLLQGGYRGPAELQCEFELTGANGSPVSLNNTFWADHREFQSGNLTPAFMHGVLARELSFLRAQASRGGWDAARQA